MRALIVGSTGMVGSEVLHQCLARKEFTKITTLDRASTASYNKKVTAIAHPDFSSFEKIKSKLQGHDVVFYCVGVYTGSVPEKVFAQITVDYLDALAKTVANKRTTFVLFSAQGANSNSKVMFAKYKGIAEEKVSAQEFKATYFFRPGYIHPLNPAKRHKSIFYRALYVLNPMLQFFFPNHTTTSEQLAKAMVIVAIAGNKQTVLENRDIKAIVKAQS